jgi:hypothetical protein
MLRLMTVFAAAVVFGCGGDARGSEAVVKEWGEAVNDRDWGRACELSAAPEEGCEDSLRGDLARVRLVFDGPATNGGGLKPGEEHFSFRGSGGTVFVTAVPKGDEFRVRIEAIVVR